jgi:hypothetical protein
MELCRKMPNSLPTASLMDWLAGCCTGIKEKLADALCTFD